MTGVKCHMTCDVTWYVMSWLVWYITWLVWDVTWLLWCHMICDVMTSVIYHMTCVGCHMTNMISHDVWDITWYVMYVMTTAWLYILGVSLIKDLKWRCTDLHSTLSTAQSSYASPLVFPAFDKQILQPIRAIKSLNNNNIKFRTFICLAMSKGMLSDWLEALPKQKGNLLSFSTYCNVCWCVFGLQELIVISSEGKVGTFL